jgi:hypothetical protein
MSIQRTFLIISCLVMLPAASWGQTRSQHYGNTLTRQTQTAFMTMDYGLLTYESKAVASNATAPVTRFRVGGYAGENRVLGVFLDTEQARTSFNLNKSSIGTRWQDLYMRFRMDFISLDLIGGLANIDIKREEGAAANIYGYGIGGGAAIDLPLNRSIVVHLHGKSVLTSEAHEESGRQVALGRRDHAEANVAFDIDERFLDVLFGYRYRQYNIKIDETQTKEVQSAPYAGMRLGIYF